LLGEHVTRRPAAGEVSPTAVGEAITARQTLIRRRAGGIPPFGHGVLYACVVVRQVEAAWNAGIAKLDMRDRVESLFDLNRAEVRPGDLDTREKLSYLVVESEPAGPRHDLPGD